MMKNTKPKRIGIDARFYGPISKGIGRYVQEVTDNIIRIDSENEYVIFLNENNYDEFDLDQILEGNQAEIKKRKVKKVKVNIKWYGLKEQLIFPLYILKERLDLMHFPHFNVPILTPVKFIVTVHDLILTKYPTIRATTLSPWLYKIKNFFYKVVIGTAVWRARKVIAVSNYTRDDVVEQFKVKPERVIVTYEGVANLSKGRDSLFVAKLDEKETLENYHILNPYLLYVGNAYPHKNLETLLAVFKSLITNHSSLSFVDKNNQTRKIEDLRLVLVGREDYFYERIKDCAKNLNLYAEDKKDWPVIFPGHVPDAKLEILFKGALAYVFPSLHEGFGLPPLEAMAKGCPVVSSDKTSLPELLGQAAIYFNPEQTADMENKIIKIIKDQDLREDLTGRGYEQVKRYSWWECANKTWKIYGDNL